MFLFLKCGLCWEVNVCVALTWTHGCVGNDWNRGFKGGRFVWVKALWYVGTFVSVEAYPGCSKAENKFQRSYGPQLNLRYCYLHSGWMKCYLSIHLSSIFWKLNCDDSPDRSLTMLVYIKNIGPWECRRDPNRVTNTTLHSTKEVYTQCQSNKVSL